MKSTTVRLSLALSVCLLAAYALLTVDTFPVHIFIPRIRLTLMFRIGGSCVLALDVAEVVIGDEILDELQIHQPMKTVRGFCDIMLRNSLEGIIIFKVIPRIIDLVQMVTNGTLTDRVAHKLYRFADLVERIALQIETAKREFDQALRGLEQDPKGLIAAPEGSTQDQVDRGDDDPFGSFTVSDSMKTVKGFLKNFRQNPEEEEMHQIRSNSKGHRPRSSHRYGERDRAIPDRSNEAKQIEELSGRVDSYGGQRASE